jgi:hypothetical protein
MAKHPALFPTWIRTLDAAIEEGAPIRASCTKCRQWQDVDLVVLRERVGGSYSLINRRTRCRITEGCNGWNRFHYLLGVFRPLWDDATSDRWMLEK